MDRKKDSTRFCYSAVIGIRMGFCYPSGPRLVLRDILEGISTGILCLAGPGLVLRDIPLTSGICYRSEQRIASCLYVYMLMMALAGWQAPALAVSRALHVPPSEAADGKVIRT